MPPGLVPKLSYGPGGGGSTTAQPSGWDLPRGTSLVGGTGLGGSRPSPFDFYKGSTTAAAGSRWNASMLPASVASPPRRSVGAGTAALGHLFQRTSASAAAQHQVHSPSPTPAAPEDRWGAASSPAARFSNQPPLQALNIPEAVEAYVAAHNRPTGTARQQPASCVDAAENDYEEELDDVDGHQRLWDVSTTASTASMPPLPSDDAPLVPMEFLRHCAEPLPWQGHPSAPIVLALLNARGVFLPANKDVVAYHMAPGFLKALHHLSLGSYFIKYGTRKSAPKERFFSIRMLDNAAGIAVPYLCWTVHQHAMQLIDKVPLTQFVGISTGTREVAFQRYMVTGNIIKGCRQGPHHAKLPTHGAFTLWFMDQRHPEETAKGLALLTCSTSVFELWNNAMHGVAAVNSVSTREVQPMQQTNGPAGGRQSDLDAQLARAQAQVRGSYLEEEDYSDEGDYDGN